jgi:hypothetical protein
MVQRAVSLLHIQEVSGSSLVWESVFLTKVFHGVSQSLLANVRIKRMQSSGMLCHVTHIRTNVSEDHRFLQETHGVTSQKMAFFIVATVKTSNLKRQDKTSNYAAYFYILSNSLFTNHLII